MSYDGVKLHVGDVVVYMYVSGSNHAYELVLEVFPEEDHIVTSATSSFENAHDKQTESASNFRLVSGAMSPSRTVAVKI